MYGVKWSKVLTVALSVLMVVASAPVVALADDTLVFMQWSLGQVMDAWWEETLNEFGELYNVKVERVFETTFTDRLLTLMAAGQGPDVFLVRFDIYPSLAAQGALLDLTDRIEGDTDLAGALLPQDRSRSMLDGKWYGLGFKYAFAHTFYNREFFAQSGVPNMPLSGDEAWQWEEFVDALRKLTRMDSEGKVERWGLSLPMTNWARMGSLIHSFGVDIVGTNGFDISSPEAVNAIMTLRELHERGVLAPHAGVANSRNRLPGQQAAIIMDLDSDPHGVLTAGDLGMDWYGLGTYPAGLNQSVGRSYMFGENIAVNAYTSKPDLAYEFLKFAALRSWNVDSDMPYLFQGRSGEALHVDEPALAKYAFGNTTMVTPFLGQEAVRDAAMAAVRLVVEGKEPPSHLAEVQRQIDAQLAEVQASIRGSE